MTHIFYLKLNLFITKSPLILFFLQPSLLLHLSPTISPEPFWHAHCSAPLRALLLILCFPIMHCCRLLLPKTPLNLLSCIGSAVSPVGAVNQHIRNWLRFHATALIMPGAKWAVHARGRLVHFVAPTRLHWIDKPITERWKEPMWQEFLQLPGWNAV